VGIKRRFVLGTLLSIAAGTPCGLEAQTATQVVTFSVLSSTRVAIGNLTAPAPTEVAPGARARTSAMVAGTSYAVATNEENQKITASIDAPVPSVLSLSVSLVAPRGAVSRGLRSLTTSATDVVTGITGSDGAALPMKYQWNRTSNAPAEALNNRVVTYTITAGS
jgi:hypothetical protein